MAKSLNKEDINAERMQGSLLQLGINDIDVEGLKAVIRNKPDPYQMGRWIMKDENKIKLEIKFDKSFGLDHYVAKFVPTLSIQHAIINRVDTKSLEERMKSADWFYAHTETPEQVENEFRKIEKIESDINRLVKSPEGLRMATILWNNNVPFYTATKPPSIRAYEESSDLYVTQKFSGDISFGQAYAALVDAHEVNLQREGKLSHAEPQKINLSNEKNMVMITEQELSQNRREFGLIGASNAFNEDLIQQMKSGVPKIEHRYASKNAVTGDEAETVFYLNKSDKNNLYFLNKWDVTVKKFGTEEPVRMTFFMNDLKRLDHVLKNPEKLVTTFTHARSINYLCGRPVLNTYKNQNGKIKKVWDQAYPNEKQLNGRMKERSFHEEYGFDLRKVGDEYHRGIKSLSNSEYGERFYQSLERGNLEKAIFVEKDGKENHYYVTPNIVVGCFNIYTDCSKNAKPLRPEQQAEKGFISPEFAHRLQERMNQMEKEKQTHKQNKVSENNSQENHTINKKQTQDQSIVKKNKQGEKIKGETGKPKRKLKPKIS